MKSTRKTSQIPASGAEFTIFDEDCDVDIKLSGDASDKVRNMLTIVRPTFMHNAPVMNWSMVISTEVFKLDHKLVEYFHLNLVHCFAVYLIF